MAAVMVVAGLLLMLGLHVSSTGCTALCAAMCRGCTESLVRPSVLLLLMMAVIRIDQMRYW